jgi:hypothetical protein
MSQNLCVTSPRSPAGSSTSDPNKRFHYLKTTASSRRSIWPFDLNEDENGDCQSVRHARDAVVRDGEESNVVRAKSLMRGAGTVAGGRDGR